MGDRRLPQTARFERFCGMHFADKEPERSLPMMVDSMVMAAASQPLQSPQPEIAMRVMKSVMESEQDLVAQILNVPGQISSQVYNGHGQVIPTPAGSNVDMKA
jgi:hypothetical protein